MAIKWTAEMDSVLGKVSDKEAAWHLRLQDGTRTLSLSEGAIYCY